jgi:hypothetical protein
MLHLVLSAIASSRADRLVLLIAPGLFHSGDLLYAARVATALKPGAKPSIYGTQGNVERDQPLAKRDHVGIIVCARISCRRLIPHYGTPFPEPPQTIPRSHSPRDTASAAGRMKSG